MTDTTDIAALREQAETAKACGGMFAISGEKALSLLDQLEAERQRAAGSEEKLHKALHREKAVERKLLAAQEELAALKGDQVPVSMDSLRDAVAEMSGGLPME